MKKKLSILLLIFALFLAGCQQTAPADGPGLTVHFLDVGQADAILLESGEEFFLIDGGNREDSQFLVSYLEYQGVEELSGVLCTHPHEDHVGGLPAVLAVFPTQAVYAPSRTYASQVYDDFLYYTHQQGLEVTIPNPGDIISLGQTRLEILGPVKSYPETNDTSLVLRAEYGESVFLFTGDMEKGAEADLLDAGADVKADVLKVGHHGSDTSTGDTFLRAVDPQYAVISVGRGNSYGHPHRETMARISGATCLRTDQLGTIRAYTDGKEITFTWENQSTLPENTLPQEESLYIGNKNSKVFHSPLCGNLPAEKNQVEFSTYEEAQAQGYRPCSSCLG